MRFSTRSCLGLSMLLLLVLATGLGLYTSSRGAAQAAGPRVWLSQKVGPPTASMQLQGNRFGVNETVLAYFDDTTQIGSITTDATGQFVLQVTVPKTALPGTHTVRATGQSSGLTTLALFLVRTDWTQLGFGPSHLGNNPYENVLTTSNVSGLTLDWSHPTIDTSPVVANGVVYASSHNELYALDAVTGTLKWSYPTGRSINSSPAVANGVVYVGSNDYNLYALDAVTGALKWSGNTCYTSAVVVNGVVYVLGGVGNGYGLLAFHLPGMS